ncbi:calcitonin gene-related peptide type 1 receptor-like [Ctenocephalides felis]|uniref:calcitonin gene-related peptide type 1 receptor-like n=1 Tax=Ctenocephalides felis TaxID=7515 RepID=UPI000E6E2B42|nr:calcitonin gene-related peptide type 1 receptor-like [Ctenocephalides felis]
MGCYIYNINAAFSADVGIYKIKTATATINNKKYKYPVFQTKENKILRFDQNDLEVQKAIRLSFSKDSFYNKWWNCCEDGFICCKDIMYKTNIIPDASCPAIWDAWTCFEKTKPDSVVEKVCSPYSYSNEGPRCHHFSSKVCYKNGTWHSDTDYSTCSVKPRLVSRTTFHVATLALSIVACTPAIAIFLLYKKLRVARVAQHRNLLIAIVLRNALVIIFKQTVVMDELNAGTVMSTNDWPCKMLSVLERLSANAVFACMLMDGIFLHRLIAMVSSKIPDMKWYYAAGAVLSVAPALIWAGLMSANDGLHCWAVDDADDGFQWTNDATRLLMLIVNTILMFHIVWVLITKVKSRTDGEKVKTARITLYMMPLFGLPFLLTMARPDTDSCTWEQVYFFVYYSIDGLQGLTVALLFCYFNKEVKEQLLSTYNHFTGKTDINRRKTMSTNADIIPTARKSILTTFNPA